MITLRIKADIQNDRRVVVTLPLEVPTGPAELVVTVDSPMADQGAQGRELQAAAGSAAPLQFASALEFLESLPVGPRAFTTWTEYERHLQEEKDAWDR